MKPDEPEKLDLRSHDVAEARRQELLRLFPEVRTEGGKLVFERLKLALGETLDAGKERYGYSSMWSPSTLRNLPRSSVRSKSTLSSRAGRSVPTLGDWIARKQSGSSNLRHNPRRPAPCTRDTSAGSRCSCRGR